MDCCLIVEAGQVSQDSYVKERRDFQAKEWLAAQSKLKEENEKPYFHGAMWLVDPSECVGVNIGRDPNCYILLNHQEISSHHLHITWDQEEIAELGRHLQQSDLPFFTTKSLQHHNAAENLVADAACCLNVIDASFNGSFIKGKRLPKNDVHKCGLGEEISFGRGMYDQGMLIPLVSFSFKLVRSSNPLVSIIKATPSPPVATILERARLDPSPFARADRSPFRSPHRRRTDVCVNQEYHSTLETERLTEELKSVGEERNRLLDDVCTLRMEVAEMRVGEERLQSQARESNRLRAELAECRAETEAKQRQVEQLFLENSGLNERLRKLEFEKDDVVFKADKLQEVMKSRSMEVDSLVEKVSSLNAVINRQTAKTESLVARLASAQRELDDSRDLIKEHEEMASDSEHRIVTLGGALQRVLEEAAQGLQIADAAMNPDRRHHKRRKLAAKSAPRNYSTSNSSELVLSPHDEGQDPSFLALSDSQEKRTQPPSEPASGGDTQKGINPTRATKLVSGGTMPPVV